MAVTYSIFLMLPILMFLASSCAPEGPETSGKPTYSTVLIENFEGNTHRAWKITGNAFSWNLAATSLIDEWGDEGYEGSHILTSWIYSDAATGEIVSPSFIIEKNYINFLVSGGGDKENLYAALVVDGQEIFRECGSNSRTMEQVVWNVSEFIGREACIKVVDNSTIAWGFINVDYFYQSDSPALAEKTRSFCVNEKYLNMPVHPDAPLTTVRLRHDGEIVYDMDLRLTDGIPSYWVWLDCSQFMDKDVEVVIPFNQFLNQKRPVAVGNGLSSMFLSSSPKENNSFYSETLRPLVHFTSLRGWLNDPCGLMYADGKWQMSYQHNPFGTDWGNIHWGRAVSEDLVHWKELDDILRPDDSGSMFSGYSVKSGSRWYSFYTAAGEYNYASRDKAFTTCMAYSDDDGATWTKYENNPVLQEVVFQNRDPHVVWSPEDGKWVMVLFLSGNTYGFFESSDLISWSETSRIDIPDDWECPDFIRMKVEETGEWKWVLLGVKNNYYVGDFSGGRFTPSTPLQKQDLSTSYLAAHTFAEAPDGRHVQIGCIGGSYFPQLPFDQMMGFPKELSLHRTADGYRLHALPVAEISNAYGPYRIVRSEVMLSDDDDISMSGAAFHIKAVYDLADTDADVFGFEVNGIKVSYSRTGGNFEISGSGLSRSYVAGGVLPDDDILEMEIILDTGMVEAFINDGEYSATVFYLTNAREKNVSHFVEGGQVMAQSLEISALEPFWK